MILLDYNLKIKAKWLQYSLLQRKYVKKSVDKLHIFCYNKNISNKTRAEITYFFCRNFKGEQVMKVKPIKSLEKIEEMKQELEKQNNSGIAEKTTFEKKRNRALFCLGINSALRVSDIVTLDLNDIFNADLTFRNVIGNEQKTKKYKEFPLTDTLQAEMANYICTYLGIVFNIFLYDINDYYKLSSADKEKIKEIINTKPLFPSERTNGYLSRVQVYRVLNEAADKIGLEKIGTHTMRKTFGYWFYKRTKDIAMLQKMLNHSSIRETLIYIDIEQEEINNAYRNFGL